MGEGEPEVEEEEVVVVVVWWIRRDQMINGGTLRLVEETMRWWITNQRWGFSLQRIKVLEIKHQEEEAMEKEELYQPGATPIEGMQQQSAGGLQCGSEANRFCNKAMPFLFVLSVKGSISMPQELRGLSWAKD
ncbi:hypothetical protein ABZP36_029187 [Zizania latifolia]